jgi:hypothetical protein
MHIQQVTRDCSQSLIGVHAHSMDVQKVFNTHSLAFLCTQIAFRGCSILTQRCSHALTIIQGPFSSDTNEIFLMVTPWWVMLNNDSMAFMRTQWLLTLTQWHSCPLNGCSGAVLNHSLACTCTHKHSWSVQSVFSLFMYFKARKICFLICKAQKGRIKLLSISMECHFFGFAKQEKWEIMMSHLNRWLVGGLGVRQWDWQQKLRKYCKKIEK